MKSKYLFVMFFIMAMPLVSIAQNNFYYYFNEKIYLDPVPNKYTVEFIDSVDESIFTTNNFEFTHLKNKLYEVSGDYFAILNASNGAYHINQLYNYYGENAYIKNEISLRYNDNVTPVQIQSLETQYNLINIINDPQLKVYKTLNPLVVANAIYETGLVKYCQPIFIANYVFFNPPTDEYFVNQFYLHNTGQQIIGNNGIYYSGTDDADIDALEAWDITLGNSDIEVAVIDEGVSPNHPDLPNLNIELGSNFHDGSGTTSDQPYPHNNGNHGNAIAGIIAASINNGGIVGVAPETTIMPVKIDLDSEPTLAQAIYFAENSGAHVISISWGINLEFPLPDSSITDAIRKALLWGTPVVIAAGNTANHISNNNGFVAYPANLDEDDFVGSSYPEMDIIAVGASDRNNYQANYSPTDDELDICAPSHSYYHINNPNEGLNVWTIDIPGEDGYNFWHQIQGTSVFDYLNGTYLPDNTMGSNYQDYTGHMGGTSASAPQVAGVIALMKSVNSCLSVPQINEILKVSADKVGEYNYNWSSARPGHSKELGYGKLNAFNAVSMAQEFYNQGTDLFIKDYIEDVGIEPTSNSSPSLSDFQYDNSSRFALWSYDSPDIWVRNQPDGMTNQTSENIEYIPGQNSYVYVKVRTKGCENSTATEQLELYWSKAATRQEWPEYWNGDITEPVLMGGYIGSQLITQAPVVLNSPYIPYAIIEFEWETPNPADYEGIAAYPWSFSFLARIISSEDPITLPASQAGNISHYVTANNNIAAKNITVINEENLFSKEVTQGVSLMVNNPNEQAETFELYFRNSAPLEANSIFKEAEVQITLDNALWDKWVNGGFVNENIIICDDENHIVMVNNEEGGALKNLSFTSNDFAFLSTKISFLTKEVSNREQYDLFIVQKIASSQEIVGGSKIIIKKPPRDTFTAFAGNDISVSADETITLSANDINENATYNWYDEEGNLVFTGIEYLLTPEVTKNYRLEIIADSDGYKDYDEVTVSIKLPEITSLSPNPANQSNDIIINYNAENASSLYLFIMPLNGSFNDDFTLDINQSQTIISTNTYTTGLYFISLLADGQIVDQKTVIIN